VQTLNPFKMTGYASWRSTKFVTESLFERQGDDFFPLLGLSYQISKTEKTLSVELRQGVEFHNGEKLTNKNIKFTYDCFMDELYEAGIWKPMFKGVERIELIGDYKFKIFFKRLTFNEVSNFLANFRVLPVSFYAIENKDKWSRQLIGTGPYKLKSFQPNGNIRLVKNPSWWKGGDKLKIPNLSIMYIKDTSLAYQMNQSDLVDVYPVESVVDFLQVKDKKNLNYVENRNIGSYQIYLRFNFKKKLFTQKMREALSHLINFDLINEKIFKGKLKRSLDSFDSDMEFYPKGEFVKYDPKKAGQILSQEGWLDLDQNGVREKVFGEKKRPLEFEILVSNYSEKLIATLIQEELKQHGVGVRVQLTPSSNSLYQTIKDGKFDLQLRTGDLYTALMASYLNSKNFYNYSGYKNSKVDELTEKIDLTFDLNKRKRILRDIVLETRKDHRTIPGLHYKGSFYLVSTGTKVNPDKPLDPVYWGKSVAVSR